MSTNVGGESLKNKFFYFMILLTVLIFSAEYFSNKGKTVVPESKVLTSVYNDKDQNGTIETELESGIIQSHVIKESGAVIIKVMDSKDIKTIEADKIVDFREGKISRDVSYSVIQKNKSGNDSSKRVIVIHNKISGNGDKDRAMTRDRNVLKDI